MMKPSCLILLLLILTLVLSPKVLADCNANMSTVNFGDISPIANIPTTASGTITVTCTWSPASVLLNVLVCAHLGAGDGSSDLAPRSLANGSNFLRYNLYTDSAYSTIWGSTTNANAATPLSMTLRGRFALSTVSVSTTATIYGKVSAGQTSVPTVNNSSTVYTQSFSGAQTRLDFQYYARNPPTCASMAAQTARFPFKANASVINNCNITTTPLNFGSNTLLSSAVSSSATINVQCTNGDAYEVALDGGTTSGSVSGRQMVGSNSGDKVSYQLYLDSAHGSAWGDGSSGTSMAAGTGSGTVQSFIVYGLVPIQPLPTPDTYSDTVKATVYF